VYKFNFCPQKMLCPLWNDYLYTNTQESRNVIVVSWSCENIFKYLPIIDFPHFISRVISICCKITRGYFPLLLNYLGLFPFVVKWPETISLCWEWPEEATILGEHYIRCLSFYFFTFYSPAKLLNQMELNSTVMILAKRRFQL